MAINDRLDGLYLSAIEHKNGVDFKQVVDKLAEIHETSRIALK